jgi:hypothetical protein
MSLPLFNERQSRSLPMLPVATGRVNAIGPVEWNVAETGSSPIEIRI